MHRLVARAIRDRFEQADDLAACLADVANGLRPFWYQRTTHGSTATPAPRLSDIRSPFGSTRSLPRPAMR